MDFSSKVPVFLDPPTWHQGVHQEITNQPSSGIMSNDPLQILPQPVDGSSAGGGGLGLGSIRPGSMVDRARLARVPLPEAGLKCPRCESTNTKFCYFNNYNLSQPRHFCKACRRYWTRGGALRNVPVGGGCRRNKRSKAKSRTGSKTDPGQTQNIRRDDSSNNNNSNHSNLLSSSLNTSRHDLVLPPQPDPFLPGLNPLNGYGSGFGLNLGGRGTGEVEHFPGLLSGCVTGNALYPFEESGLPDQNKSGFDRVDESLNFSKNFMLGIQGNNNIGDQYSSWGAGINTWTDVSGFHGSSSSSGRLL